MSLTLVVVVTLFVSACDRTTPFAPAPKTATTSAASTGGSGLWPIYQQSLKDAKYIDLTHTLMPSIPVWKGFGPSKFGPTINPENGKPYEYAKDGFEATQYNLSTDQFGTQLDPPAHWAPEYPAIDELPATYAVRPLVVISIVEQVAKNPGYHLQVSDIEQWEAKNGNIPEGSVVMVRSDWSKELAQSRIGDAHGLPRRAVGRAKVPTSAASYSLPRSRTARHRHNSKARGRILADAQRLHSSRRRRQPRQNPGYRLSGGHRLSNLPVAWAVMLAILPSVLRIGSMAFRWARCRKRRCPRATRFYTGTPSEECASAKSRFGLYARVVPSSRFALLCGLPLAGVPYRLPLRTQTRVTKAFAEEVSHNGTPSSATDARVAA